MGMKCTFDFSTLAIDEEKVLETLRESPSELSASLITILATRESPVDVGSLFSLFDLFADCSEPYVVHGA